MGIIDDITIQVMSINRDESLSAMLRGVIEQQAITRPSPKNYYYVTQLANPTETYFSKLFPNTPIPPGLGRKLARGTQLHSFASIWLKNLPDFIIDEGTIDGVWEGIEGVRGKVDYIIGNSILELKTKDKNPGDIEEIFLHYPQDLEQLAFYSVIHPSKPIINYLVFMENASPFKLKAFKVKIENRDLIQEILKSRIISLDESIKTKNPSLLGKCRYFEFNCKFVSQKICSCSEFKPFNLDKIMKSVTVQFDSDFTYKLEEARKQTQISDFFCVSTFDIIAPRKHYMNTLLGVESDFEGDPMSDEYKACLWTSLNFLKKKYNINLNYVEMEQIKNSLQDHRVRIGFRWLKLKKSGSSEDQIVPYLLKVSKAKYIDSTKKPSSYNLAELGIICGLYGKNNGLIFTVYPNLKNLIITYNITYKSDKYLSRLVKDSIDTIERAEQSRELFSLPECPDFFDQDKKCSLTKICHSPDNKIKNEKDFCPYCGCDYFLEGSSLKMCGLCGEVW
jgi:hypothetical protein